MRSFSTLFLLATISGCSYVYETNNYYQAADENTDTGEIADTDVVDTDIVIEDTDVVDTGEVTPDCHPVVVLEDSLHPFVPVNEFRLPGFFVSQTDPSCPGFEIIGVHILLVDLLAEDWIGNIDGRLGMGTNDAHLGVFIPTSYVCDGTDCRQRWEIDLSNSIPMLIEDREELYIGMSWAGLSNGQLSELPALTNEVDEQVVFGVGITWRNLDNGLEEKADMYSAHMPEYGAAFRTYALQHVSE